MSEVQQTADKDLVVGLGATGLSIARYLKRNDCNSPMRSCDSETTSCQGT
jgi:UDP-N-acetylmuramoylalanine-D-glutamate ligase